MTNSLPITVFASLTPSAAKVYHLYVLHGNGKGVAWPSEALLAEEAGTSLSTVARAKRELIKAGLIEATGKAGVYAVRYIAIAHDSQPVTSDSNPVTHDPSTSDRQPVTHDSQTVTSDSRSKREEKTDASHQATEPPLSQQDQPASKPGTLIDNDPPPKPKAARWDQRWADQLKLLCSGQPPPDGALCKLANELARVGSLERFESTVKSCVASGKRIGQPEEDQLDAIRRYFRGAFRRPTNTKRAAHFAARESQGDKFAGRK